MKRVALLAGLALTLSACGLHPLYSGGGSGAVATTLTRIEVGPIEGKAGWLMTNALHDRLAASGSPLYRLEIKLDDQIIGLGVRRDDSVSRERRTLRARYQLVDLESSALKSNPGRLADEAASMSLFGGARHIRITGVGDECLEAFTLLLDATAGSDAGIDVVSSEYATIAAENSALERLSDIVADEIVARVALYAQRTSAPAK